MRALLSLGGNERLAAVGAVVCAASLIFPWYRLPFAPGLDKSGLAAFGFADAALLITLGGALYLLVQVGRGRRPPLPLHEGTLLALAGIWSALIVGFLMVDRPTGPIAGFPADYGLGYGIFVAMGGAAALALAGLGIRRRELQRESAASLSPDAEAARTPTSSSPTRFPR